MLRQLFTVLPAIMFTINANKESFGSESGVLIETTIDRLESGTFVRVISSEPWSPLYLELARVSLPPDLVHVQRSKVNGSLLAIGAPAAEPCLYEHVGPLVKLSVSDCDGHRRGILIYGAKTYLISPANEEQRIMQRLDDHIRVRRDTSEQRRCALDTDRAERYDDFIEDLKTAPTSRRVSTIEPVTVELAVFVDEPMYKKFVKEHGANKALTAIQNYVMTVFHNIQLLYNHPSLGENVKFKIVRYEVFTSFTEDLSGHSNVAGVFLDRFCGYAATLDGKWDHAFLFTGEDLVQSGSPSISGIAKLGGMCRSWGSCTVSEGHDFVAVFIGAHELGHSFGLTHDDARCGSGYIMATSLGGGKVTWSTCSKRQLQKFLTRIERSSQNCLAKSTNKPELVAIRGNELPGQIFSGTKQCRMMHGKDYHQVTNHLGDRVCAMLWCKKYQSDRLGQLITSHPALEGTFCDTDKWCVGGKCVSWKDKPKDAIQAVLPRRIDGGWSPFRERRCSICPPCGPFRGSIPIVKASRSCDDPTPRNGGTECSGAPARGLICPDQGCAMGYNGEMQDYLDGTCRMRKRDTRDEQLTGVGTQLRANADRACKVFCLVSGAKRETYRHFGDILPDGSSCGHRKYCVEGRCLGVGCSDRALVEFSYHCPSSSSVTCASYTEPKSSTSVSTPKKPSNIVPRVADVPKTTTRTSTTPAPTTTTPAISRWSPWSYWSDCSATCDTGTKKRTRSCHGVLPCHGSRSQTQFCNTQRCPPSSWRSWGSWGLCSVTCGKGTLTRRRVCPDNTCVGEDEEKAACGGPQCPFSAWSACTKTCGGGTQRRTRACPGGSCDGGATEFMELRPCNDQLCHRPNPVAFEGPRYSLWSTWTVCSRSCGTGEKYRARSCSGRGCDSDSKREIATCNNGVCSRVNEWTDWSLWSPCTSRCGEGIKVRTRACSSSNCVGKKREKVKCLGASCRIPEPWHEPLWSFWSEWSSCKPSCGKRARRRTCFSFTKQTCSGLPVERQSCTNLPECTSRATPAFDHQTTTTKRNQYTDWSPWSLCSRTCGIGKKTRARSCAYEGTCVDKRQREIASCVGPPCFA